MFATHYPALFGAYAVAMLGWLVANRLVRDVWPASASPAFAHPWRELGIALLAGLLVPLVGQLYIHGFLLPETGSLRPLTGTVNQVIIFLPILLLLPLRHQPWSTAWLSTRKLGIRVIIGLALAVLAVIMYSLLRSGVDHSWQILGRIARYQNLDKFVQVFLEDITIAVLFVRFAAAVGNKWATIVVGILFAAGHIPTMIASGASVAEFTRLFLDAALSVAVISVLCRSRDVVWFAFVHFCLDMIQFSSITLGHKPLTP